MESDPGVGVGVVNRNSKRVLLPRRKFVHGHGSWSTPGGHQGCGESPEACAIRGIREETGLELTSARSVALTNDVFEAEARRYVTVWMEARIAGEEARLSAAYESDAIGWFAWDDLPQPPFPPFRHLIDGGCYPSGAMVAR